MSNAHGGIGKMIVKIYSKNAAYQKFEVLKTNRNKRYRYNEFFAEGVRNINQAVKNGWEINSFIYSGEAALSDWAKDMLKNVRTQTNYELTSALMAELSSKEDTSELLAVIKMREDNLKSIPLGENPLIVLLDKPSNKGNLGTILRSCDSFGVNGVIITGHAVDLYEPDVISASMGSFFNVNCVRVNDNTTLFNYIQYLRSKYENMQIIGTTAHKQHSIYNLNLLSPSLIMIGNETFGLNSSLKAACDLLATIPMSEHSSASSLNIGCAATVFLYEAARQRSKKDFC